MVFVDTEQICYLLWSEERAQPDRTIFSRDSRPPLPSSFSAILIVIHIFSRILAGRRSPKWASNGFALNSKAASKTRDMPNATSDAFSFSTEVDRLRDRFVGTGAEVNPLRIEGSQGLALDSRKQVT